MKKTSYVILASLILALSSCEKSPVWEKYAGQWTVSDNQSSDNCLGGINNYNINILQEGNQDNKIRVYNFAGLWQNAYVSMSIDEDGKTLSMQEQDVMDVYGDVWNVQLIEGEIANENLIKLKYRLADFCVIYGDAVLTR